MVRKLNVGLRFGILFLSSFCFRTVSFAKVSDCGVSYEFLDKVTPSSFFRHAKEEGEVVISEKNFERARNLAYHFPASETLGVNFSDPKNAKRYLSRLERSRFFGQAVGWEVRTPAGGVARVRIDWDPQKGAHFNIEYLGFPDRSNHALKRNYKAVIEFPCADHPCSEEETFQAVRHLFR